jgi:hypothetical protein
MVLSTGIPILRELRFKNLKKTILGGLRPNFSALKIQISDVLATF